MKKAISKDYLPMPEPTGPKRTRSVNVQLADNGYVVRITESDYKEVELVFTSQSAMIKTVKEATTMKVDEED